MCCESSGIWGQLFKTLTSSLKIKEEQTTGIWHGLYLNRHRILKTDNLWLQPGVLLPWALYSLQEKSFYLYLSRLLISMLSYFCYLLTVLKAERGAVEQVGCGTVGHSADLYFHCSTSALWNLKSVHFGAGSFLWQRASIRKTPRGLEKYPHYRECQGTWVLILSSSHKPAHTDFLLALVLALWDWKTKKVSQTSGLFYLHNSWSMRHLWFLQGKET